jgi:glycosyltransferase involved in cell wall biosynthesis
MDVSVVIPAYNEEKTIAGVIRTVRANPRVKEIVVVNDGSTDRTGAEIRQFGKDVVFLDYKTNRGKGFALHRGIRKAAGPVIVLLDADLAGLKPAHVDRLARPLEAGEVDLVLAPINLIREEDERYLDLIKGPYEWWRENYAALVTGQRAGFRKDFIDIQGMEDTKYGVDLLMTDYYLAGKKRVKRVIFDDVRHLRKTEKWGREGKKLRTSMYKDMLRVLDKLEAKGSLIAQGFLPKVDAKSR